MGLLIEAWSIREGLSKDDRYRNGIFVETKMKYCLMLVIFLADSLLLYLMKTFRSVYPFSLIIYHHHHHFRK